MELTINVQVGVSPEVAELVRKTVATIMPVGSRRKCRPRRCGGWLTGAAALRQEDDSKERTPLRYG